MGPVQRERRRGRLGRDQRVDDDDARVALDEGHVREVEAAHLVDAGSDLVQALLGGELALAPQAGVRGVGRVRVQERVDVVVPDNAAVAGLDDRRFEPADEAAIGVLEIGAVMEVERRGHGSLPNGPRGPRSVTADIQGRGVWVGGPQSVADVRPDPRDAIR